MIGVRDIRPGELAGETPTLVPSLMGEFFLWLWWRSQTGRERIDLVGADEVTLMVHARLALADRTDPKSRAVLTGDRVVATPESHAAVAGGKLPSEIQLDVTKKDWAFVLTLRGIHLDVSGLRLPGTDPVMESDAKDDEARLLARLLVIEDAYIVIDGLFRVFARERLSPRWELEIGPKIREWIAADPEN